MKWLPNQDENWKQHRKESVQEFRFTLSKQIQQELFYATFMKSIESKIKSNAIVKILKRLIQQQGYYS